MRTANEIFENLEDVQIKYLEQIPCTYIFSNAEGLFRIGVSCNPYSEALKLKKSKNDTITCWGILSDDILDFICEIFETRDFQLIKDEWNKINNVSLIRIIIEGFNFARFIYCDKNRRGKKAITYGKSIFIERNIDSTKKIVQIWSYKNLFFNKCSEIEKIILKYKFDMCIDDNIFSLYNDIGLVYDRF